MTAIDAPTPEVLTEPVDPSQKELVTVVGFDGSIPSVHALEAAARFSRGRESMIVVVYVAHRTTTEAMSPSVVAELDDTFNDIARDLEAQARAVLGEGEHWLFQRRDGAVVDELIDEAAVLAKAGPGTQVLIAIGSPAHRYHRVMGSVATGLVHRAHVPLVMVP